MKIVKKVKGLTPAFLAVFVVGILIAGVSVMPMRTNISIPETFPLQGYWTVEVRRADGTLILLESMPNLITDIGKQHARNLFSSLNSTIINADNRTVSLSLSNDATPLASWTKLPNEITGTGLDRKGPTEVTITILNATAYKTGYTWTATGSITVQCAGVNWWNMDDSDNNLYAAGTFTQVTLTANDTIEVEYTLNFSS